MKKKALYMLSTAGFICIILCYTPVVFGQVKIGNNPKLINKDAVVEMESTNKGMLLPRLALSSTTNAAPLSSFVQGMFVFNTAAANDVTPGMYYSDGVKWIKVSVSATSSAVKKSLIMVTANGQTIFNTPDAITDINKISLYRNGVMISFTINSANSIAAEVPCVIGDEIRIIQLL